MRIPLAPRTLAATALAGGVVTVAVLGTTAQAAVPTHDDHSGRLVRGTVVARGDLNLREQPTTRSQVVGYAAPGAHVRVECAVRGQSVFGERHWYWLPEERGWANAVFVDTGHRSVPNCTDPCPRWKDCDPCRSGHGHGHDNGSGSGSGTVTFTWTFTASGTWEWDD
jgi:hypothetical protein